ncbi:o-succinylbenzoate synthase [Pustulibacterium marinum]|uniref:O-succinylbenzoate synthase n=1 Tax=Pustulibacterium marinum TaxID=1224947 RepID=A0A1I7GCW9_9FLAO|nr:o-succinylbenzoate synthase [Pustulibacterium marinum]SFU46285.1 o-succinylbenzoate synthase [Pustulibacterium marinum]
MKAEYKKYILNFKRPSGTSRGVLTTKETWFLILSEDNNIGVGECGILRTLSFDDRPDYEQKLKWVCEHIYLGEKELLLQLEDFPSIQFGLEQAFLSLKSKSKFELFPSEFTNGKTAIPINGLVWMGEKEFMKSQIEEKLKAGFDCIKLKIGAIDFDAELDLLKYIRSQFTSDEIEIRVDANGAFQPKNALEKLKRLSEFELHSIEQPIKTGQVQEMAKLCETTPLDIALDEELIGVTSFNKKQQIVTEIQPQYIILKPSLIGGFQGSKEWIELAEKNSMGWWITSALESNVGLNAIAQFTYTLNSKMPQGLGTGSLYTNNFDSPLEVKQGTLTYDPNKDWNFNLI